MAMKKSIIFLLFALLISGCAEGTLNLGAPPFPPDLCVEFEQYKEQSLLLNIQEQYNIPLNEVYFGLIDTSRILMISNVADKDWISEYLNIIKDFYIEKYPNLTHDQLIGYMVSQKEWGEKVELVLSILSSRIGYFRSTLLINPFDDCMYRTGWVNAKKLLFIQDVKEESINE
jgi:hypothetical protein